MTVTQAQDIFLVSRRARNLSKNTILWYKLALGKFTSYCEKNKITNITDIKTFDMELLLGSFNGIRDVTRRDYFIVFRIFFTYLFDEEYIDRNPMKKMRPPKVEQKLMRTFTKQELDVIFKSYDRSSFIGLRNYLVMCLLFSTGMRKGELIGLRLQDINITLDTLKVRGKGNKERFIPIGKTLRRVIIQYMRLREEWMKDAICEYFIVTWRKAQMSSTGVNTIFRNIKRDLGLSGERVSAHTYRHTFAKTYLLNGGDVFTLQRLMGHSDINTTKKYISLNDRELKMQYAKFNPLDNKDWMV